MDRTEDAVLFEKRVACGSCRADRDGRATATGRSPAAPLATDYFLLLARTSQDKLGRAYPRRAAYVRTPSSVSARWWAYVDVYVRTYRYRQRQEVGACRLHAWACVVSIAVGVLLSGTGNTGRATCVACMAGEEQRRAVGYPEMHGNGVVV